MKQIQTFNLHTQTDEILFIQETLSCCKSELQVALLLGSLALSLQNSRKQQRT